MSASSSVMPYVFPIFFIGAWVGVLAIISIMGGWRNLARMYRATQSFSGNRFYFQSGGMRRGTSYNNCLTVGANLYGLYLSVFLPFRFAHPPLFIPWEDISTKFHGKGWLFAGVRLQFAKCPSGSLLISKRLANRLSQASGLRFKVEADG